MGMDEGTSTLSPAPPVLWNSTYHVEPRRNILCGKKYTTYTYTTYVVGAMEQRPPRGASHTRPRGNGRGGTVNLCGKNYYLYVRTSTVMGIREYKRV